jgi:V8-like Glu-specific endopeptidase
VDHAAGARSGAYWTDRLMASATPLDGRETTREIGPPAAVPTAGATGGSRVVGALFFGNGTGRHYCTASVVGSSKRNLLITAAHCLYSPSAHTWNRHIVFVPKYSRGRRPYGTWPVWLMVADQRWIDHGDPDADVAFAAVQVMDGRRIADVVGANEMLINSGYDNRVTVIGYPSRANNPGDRPIRCTGPTYWQADRQLRFDCGGFTGGTSGSPWITEYDDETQRGYVIGVIGGYQKGGDTDWRSYSPLFDDDVGRLAITANNQA